MDQGLASRSNGIVNFDDMASLYRSILDSDAKSVASVLMEVDGELAISRQ